ncbi:MAG TPA: MlaD family protein [Solirubrobacterales bacterium]|jgi:ABC-type transporter Mla subunit MlaD|nr:MlaD family protein [Solirubrobacterales bacterium]
MSKRAPSTAQLLVIVGFALSCFGILLFLWITFGGPTPFKAKSYEIKIPFNEATQLAEQSDVRISGVSVGKVKDIVESPNGQRALATIDIEDQYAPIPTNSRAILRTKTLLGETYVELTPGNADGPRLHDGDTLPLANVAESVQLDEIFRTFDERTRTAFQEWMQASAAGIAGQGQSFSNVFAELEPTLSEFDRLFRVLDTQRLAVKQLFSNGSISFRALRGREGQLADLIDSSNAVFRTTAERDRDIEALFRAFPTFEDESRLTLDRLKEFALNTDPLMRQLVPAAQQLSPTLIAFSRLSQQMKGFFEGLEPVIDRAPTGFPAARRIFRDQFPPLLRALDPFLRNLNPIITGLGLYKHEVTGVMANVAAASNAVHLSAAGDQIHYLRTLGPFGPESLATFPGRTTTNRNSAYSPPLSALRLASGLLNFDTRQCSSGITAALDANTPNESAFNQRTENDVKKATDFFERLKHYAYGDQLNSATIPAPGCEAQPPFEPIYGAGRPATTYQHTFAQDE